MGAALSSLAHPTASPMQKTHPPVHPSLGGLSPLLCLVLGWWRVEGGRQSSCLKAPGTKAGHFPSPGWHPAHPAPHLRSGVSPGNPGVLCHPLTHSPAQPAHPSARGREGNSTFRSYHPTRKTLLPSIICKLGQAWLRGALEAGPIPSQEPRSLVTLALGLPYPLQEGKGETLKGLRLDGLGCPSKRARTWVSCLLMCPRLWHPPPPSCPRPHPPLWVLHISKGPGPSLPPYHFFVLLVLTQ